jgi:type IV fimbrial biogenesis protein FimT
MATAAGIHEEWAAGALQRRAKSAAAAGAERLAASGRCRRASDGERRRAVAGSAAAPSTAYRRRATSARRRRGGQRGFTATELLVALTIAGVLVSLAVPGFAALSRSAGLSSAANELLSALHRARSLAVLRGLPVALCLTADDRTCVAVPDSAATGWLVFVPAGSAAVSSQPVAGEVLTHFRLPDRLTVSASRPTVTFWPVSRAAATSTFDLCDLAGAGRSIIVSQTGRPRVAAEATSCV